MGSKKTIKVEEAVWKELKRIKSEKEKASDFSKSFSISSIISNLIEVSKGSNDTTTTTFSDEGEKEENEEEEEDIETPLDKEYRRLEKKRKYQQEEP